ncbi:hypothetical protein pb186bvf_020837 [Paramecium bursaria]
MFGDNLRSDYIFDQSSMSICQMENAIIKQEMLTFHSQIILINLNMNNLFWNRIAPTLQLDINVISEDQSCEWNKKEQKCLQIKQKTCNDQNLFGLHQQQIGRLCMEGPMYNVGLNNSQC